MKRLVSLALTAVAVAGAVALPGTASAGTAASPACPFTRTVCLWDSTNFTGARFNVQSIDPNTAACVNLASHGWGNGRAKSGENTGNQLAVLYSNTNCTGSSYQLVPQGKYTPITFASNSILVY